MRPCIAVINAGSSSIKFSLFDQVEHEQMRLVCSGQIEGIGVSPHFKVRDGCGQCVAEKFWDRRQALDHQRAMRFLLDWITIHLHDLGLELLGVGHRVVHGGSAYTAPVLVDDEVLATLTDYIPLAPLHQPHNLSAIRSVRQQSAEISQVVCFDTAFHHTIPSKVQRYGLPWALTDQGIRRYGFHGLSYEYIASRLPVVAPEIAGGRVVVAHLGSGASLCALVNGVSMASTLGFSTLDGLMMGTRPGNLDPGIILYLLQEKGMDAEEISELLYKQSGLLGVSGISNDMRVLLESPEPRAREAVELFVYRVGRELGSLVAALGGLDGLVFTAGIGENAPAIRAMVCQAAAWLGVAVDVRANNAGDARISTAASRVAVWVIPTNEELMIAVHTRALLLP
ncbi:MAG: acetate/propionate family kinase [Desulfopila sp.]